MAYVGGTAACSNSRSSTFGDADAGPLPFDSASYPDYAVGNVAAPPMDGSSDAPGSSLDASVADGGADGAGAEDASVADGGAADAISGDGSDAALRD